MTNEDDKDQKPKTNGALNGHGNGHDHDHDSDAYHNVVEIPTLAEREKIKKEKERAIKEQKKLWRKAYQAQQQSISEPMINLPPVTKLLLALILIPHLLIEFVLDAPAQYWVFSSFGFIPAVYTVEFSLIPAIFGPITYMFLHASWLHLGMNTLMLLAFGAGLERWMGGRQMLGFFVLTSIMAAIFHFMLDPTSPETVIGASGGISGLFAAALVMMQRNGMLPTGKYGIWPFAALWIGIAFIFGIIGSPDGNSVAWAAHIGGFLAGIFMLKPYMKRFCR